MPKAIYGFKLDDTWKEELGENWEMINQRFYGKLANLALVDYPISPNKNLTFAANLEKRDGIGGAENYTTRWIVENCKSWGLESIEARTKWLIAQITELYRLPRPVLSQKIKDKYGDHS